MSDLNKVIISGRVVRDPELRYTPSNVAVMDVSIASNRSWKNRDSETQEETTYVDITVWAKQAEALEPFVKKGQWLMVEGRLNLDTWETDGQKRSKLSMVADRVNLPPRSPGPKAQTNEAVPAGAGVATGLTADDDEIPF